MRTRHLAVVMAVFATPAAVDEFRPALEAFLESDIRGWSQAEQIVAAIRTQNAANAGLGEAEILALDTAWRAEIGAAETPTIDPVLDNAAAEFLRGQVGASGGRITEVFVVDALGLNVAASAVTSDIWQGDEAKFTETFPNGAAGSISATSNSTNRPSATRRRSRSRSSIPTAASPSVR